MQALFFEVLDDGYSKLWVRPLKDLNRIRCDFFFFIYYQIELGKKKSLNIPQEFCGNIPNAARETAEAA